MQGERACALVLNSHSLCQRPQASLRFLDAHNAQLRASAAPEPLATRPSAEAAAPVAPGAVSRQQRPPLTQVQARGGSGSAGVEQKLVHVLQTAKLLRGDGPVPRLSASFAVQEGGTEAGPNAAPAEHAARVATPPVAPGAAPPARQSIRPVAVPERLRVATAALAAHGVRPGTTLLAFIDDLADSMPRSGAADALMHRLEASHGKATSASHTAAGSSPPLPAPAALNAACGAMDWVLTAITTTVDWSLLAHSRDGAAPPAERLCVAAHTVGHALRLHADAVAALTASREATGTAHAYRDAAMARVLATSERRRPRGSSARAAGVNGEAAHDAAAPDWWLQPEVWAMVHSDAPPPVLGGPAHDGAPGRHGQAPVAVLSCTVRAEAVDFALRPVTLTAVSCISQSAEEVASLALARQAVQTEALAAAFQAGAAADVVHIAVRTRQACRASHASDLTPPGAGGCCCACASRGYRC